MEIMIHTIRLTCLSSIIPNFEKKSIPELKNFMNLHSPGLTEARGKFLPE